MFRNGALAEVVRTPLVQAGYAGIVLVAIYGHGLVSDMIESAV